MRCRERLQALTPTCVTVAPASHRRCAWVVRRRYALSMNDQQTSTTTSRTSHLSMDRFPCPHCGRPGISSRAKSRSSRGWPATCSECGGLSYNAGVFAIIATVFLAECIFPVGLLSVFFLLSERRFIPALALAAGLYLIYRVIRSFADSARLCPVTPKRSLLARRLTYIGILIAIACVIVLVLLNRNA